MLRSLREWRERRRRHSARDRRVLLDEVRPGSPACRADAVYRVLALGRVRRQGKVRALARYLADLHAVLSDEERVPPGRGSSGVAQESAGAHGTLGWRPWNAGPSPRATNRNEEENSDGRHATGP